MQLVIQKNKRQHIGWAFYIQFWIFFIVPFVRKRRKNNFLNNSIFYLFSNLSIDNLFILTFDFFWSNFDIKRFYFYFLFGKIKLLKFKIYPFSLPELMLWVSLPKLPIFKRPINSKIIFLSVLIYKLFPIKRFMRIQIFYYSIRPFNL